MPETQPTGRAASGPSNIKSPAREREANATSAILVLGMHRSGTSALARVLSFMGAYLGEQEELLPAHPEDNPTGYWERTDLVIEHDRFLNDAGYGWDRVAGFDLPSTNPDSRARLHARLLDIIRKLERHGGSWLVKDPRLCLLLPLWLQILGNAACIFVVRDPREIAASMRESHRGVYTSHYLLALWEKYLCTALATLRGMPTLFVSYSRLLVDPVAETRRIQAALAKMGVSALHEAPEVELHNFLDPQLRRSHPEPHVQLSSEQERLLAWLERQCVEPDAVVVSDFPKGVSPDETLLEFQKALDEAARGRNTALGENAQWHVQLESAIASSQSKLTEDLSESRTQMEHALAESGNLMKKLSEREQLVQSLEVERARLEQSASQQLHECEQLHERISSLLTAHEHHEQLVATISSELDQQRQQSELLRSENTHWQRRINELSGELAQMRHDSDFLNSENNQLRAYTSTLGRELRELRTESVQRQDSLLAQRRENVALEERGRQLQQRIEELSRSLSVATEHASALEAGMTALRNSFSWKATAPARAIVGAFSFRPSWNVEQALYRLYYALPGPSPARKRAFVLWLHDHATWLTRRTFSYRMNEQSKLLEQQRISDPEQRAAMQRMDEQRAAKIVQALPSRPLISIVMPVYNVEARWLAAAVESVRRQFYTNWELCIADDASTNAETKQELERIAKLRDARIKIRRLAKNAGIANASNAALALATGEFVGLLDHDDELARDALLEIAGTVGADDPDLIYSDEDKLNEAGEHVEVHCKPDYSPDYFFSVNYLCHFTVLRRSLLDKIGGFRTGFDGAQDYDLFLRATEQTTRIAHVPKVLYHWRKIAGSTAAASSAKPQTSQAGQRALSESMQRRQIDASVEPGPFANTFRIRRAILGKPLVSILIPFRDKPDLLKACVSSVLSRTRYANFEIVCIDNGSADPETHRLLADLQRGDNRVKVERYDAPFNYSAINNFGAARSKGEHLLFLNNDTEVVSGEWLDAMLEHSQRPDVGVVGARLLYADDTIQHSGVIVGPGGVAGHAHLFVPGDDPGYFGRIRLAQNLSAVTFACAMTRRSVFEQLGGLNEGDLKIAFNDVDYCLRAREAGYLIVYTPFSVLHHYESKSRGYEDTPEKQKRFATEIDYMRSRHKTLIERGDPYYNPRLSLSNSFQPDPNYVYELPR